MWTRLLCFLRGHVPYLVTDTYLLHASDGVGNTIYVVDPCARCGTIFATFSKNLK